MGGGASRPDPNVTDLRHFRMERVLGAGGFGKVHAATKKTQPNKGEFFAIKELSKMTILSKNALDEVFDELKMLSNLDYDFVCNAHYAFQDERNLYLVMDLALGGDLRFRLNQIRKQFKEENPAVLMDEPELKFDMFCVLLALNYLHKANIIFRDLKPDNVLIRSDGYIILTDFGISKHAPSGKCTDRSGTHGYMAPECYSDSHEHSYNSDIFAFGVMLHEMYKGNRPFSSDVIKNVFSITDQAELERTCMVPVNKLRKEGKASEDFCDLLGKCLTFDATARIDVPTAMAHPWFSGFTEQAFLDKTAEALFKPNTTVANCDSVNLEVAEIFEDKSSLPKPKPEENEKFAKYYFDINKQKRVRPSVVFNAKNSPQESAKNKSGKT
mmetsp:Transcript_25915/g.73454  ORF Transcript_25915/g.73454 Transcript_25915/m.73454 type:complete len:384 (+) Transcript_25915:151-1302(+)